VHTASTGQNVAIGNGTPIPDASAGFHTYAVDWEPNTITWYFDGNEVYQTATPADMHQPMYMLVDLAVGGPYGNPTSSTQFPATLQVDYIRAYATTAAPPVISNISAATAGNQIVLTGTAEGDSTVNIYEDNVLIGTAAVDGVGAWSFAAGVPASGNHSFTATDTNAANNTSPISSPLTTTVSLIHADASTSLTEVANEYFYLEASRGSGTALKYYGSDVTVGEFGGWTPIGAVQTASGFDVAWKNTSTGQYTVWATDTNGNYTASPIGTVSPTNTALESLEPVFGQDLNGDGVVGLYATPTTTLQIGSALAGPSGVATIGIGATLELAAADSSTVTFQGPTGTLRLDHSSTFSGNILNFTGSGSLAGSDQIDLADIQYSSAHYSFAKGVLTVSDGSGDTAKLSFNGSYTLASFKIASDGSGGTVVYDPPQPELPANHSKEAFVFHPSLGQAAMALLTAETHQPDQADIAWLLAVVTSDPHANAGAADPAHDAVAFHSTMLTQLHHAGLLI
jgi:hypothetical protein